MTALLAVACGPLATLTSNSTTSVGSSTPALQAEAAKQPVSAGGPTTAKRTDKTIKIGFITPLTGTLAGYGARQRIAVQLAVEDVNNEGGINGNPLAVVVVDDAANPGEDAALVRRLAKEDEVMAILGPLTNSGFETAAALANELQVPLATASAARPGVADQDRPWVFRLSLPGAVAIPKAIASFKRLYPDVKKMVITGDIKEPLSGYILKTIYPSALKEAGLQVIDTAYFDTGTADFTAIAAKVKGANAQGIALSSWAPEAVALARELQRQRVRLPVVAPLQNWGGPEICLAGDAMEGWTAAGAFDEDTQDQRGRAYMERFGRAGEADPAVGKPTHPGFWAQTYDAVMVLAQVMRKAQVTPDTDLSKARMAIRAGLQEIQGFRGITGDISVLPNGDIAAAPLSFVARGGKWVLVR